VGHGEPGVDVTGRIVVVDITRLEARHLRLLVEQFRDLVAETDAGGDDPALRRLSPPAYPDDARAAAEFRSLTASDLLERRRADAETVMESLTGAATVADDDADATDTVGLVLDETETRAWLRTLAAVRLVLATRLGVEEGTAHDDDDPRFGVYEWLGYRLEGLVRAVDGAD
jgi:hypothetical protein